MDKIPGYRFHPTDVELIEYFLKRKVMGKKFPYDAIAEVDIYKFSPWDLPDKALHKTGDLEWYFFCPTGKKYGRGARMNRVTEVGFWKTTGKDKPVEYNNVTVGMRKSLIFHKGKALKGERTDWVMHEFRLEEDKDLTDRGIPQDSYVICKVYQKEGAGPRNGAQYGKPFNEEDWDEEEEMGSVEPFPVAALPVPVHIQPIACPSSVTNVHLPTSGCIGPTSVSCVSDCLTHTSAPSNEVVDDYISSMLNQFTEDDTLAPNENIIEGPGQENNAEGIPSFDSSEIFEGLEDLGMDNFFAGLVDGADFSFGLNSECTTNQIPTGAVMPHDPSDFLQLTDLETPVSLQNELDYGFKH